MSNDHVALILVEGETEEVFYKRLAQEKLGGIPKRIRNMEGNFNINAKIVDKSVQFSIANPTKTFDVYVCVDRERVGTPVYNRVTVDEGLESIRGFQRKFDVIAELMLESLFFADIDNIYIYLRTPKNTRNKAKFSDFRKLTHRDLTRLFEANGKQYYKGHRCEPLVEQLDLDLIIGKATELELFVTKTVQRHNEFNN